MYSLCMNVEQKRNERMKRDNETREMRQIQAME